MNSDPKDCLYCQNNETQHELMIQVAKLSVSRLFIFKEQTYRGRCLVAHDEHIDDLNLLSDEALSSFMKDVAKATRAMQKVFNPDKINYGAYADTLSHLHFHLVPKYIGGPDFGGVFSMNPKAVYLSDDEYADMAEKLKKALE
ncbi:MAG: HIT family protein [Prevotella sp.]|nr:HIT family protein [Prevotella sp.]